MLERPDWKALTIDQRLELLEPHRKAGLSSTQMAGFFTNCTRNAVIGLLTRSKKPFGVSSTSVRKQKVAAVKRDPKLTREDNRQRSIMLRRQDAPPRPPAIPYSEDEPGVDVTYLLGILDVNDATCRWPHGDPLKPGFGFCGKPVKPGSVYCRAHHRRAYTS